MPRFRQNLQTNLDIEQYEKNNEQSSDFSKKILYVRNLSPVVTEEDLNEIFWFSDNYKLNCLCVPKRVTLDVLLKNRGCESKAKNKVTAIQNFWKQL